MTGVVLPGNRGLELRTVAVPRPGPGQVLVGMRASGLCGSDLRAIYRPEAQGSGPEAYRGVIAGHEPAGVVEEVGAGVSGWRPGDRVLLYHIAGCGECADCRSGWMISCTSPRRAAYGWQRDGGHAGHLLAEASTLIRLPRPLSYIDGALIACGYGTAYAACLRIDLQPNEWVVVTGLGPVGLGTVQLCIAMGARVIAVESIPERCSLGTALGAEAVLSPADATPARIADLTGRGLADAAIECSGAAPARVLSLASVRRWGRAVWVGEGGTVAFEPSPLLLHEQRTLHGSWVCSVAQMSELTERLAAWEIHPEAIVTHRFALEEAHAAYRLFDTGHTGKVVLTWDAPAGP